MISFIQGLFDVFIVLNIVLL